MLVRGAAKLARRGLARRAQLAGGDGERLPVASGAFDAALVAFGIRNVSDPLAALREVHRALRPGGRFVVLEFSMPRGPLGAAYRLYFRQVLPRLGGLISDGSAYSYLPASVARFPVARRVRRPDARGRLPRRALAAADVRHRVPAPRREAMIRLGPALARALGVARCRSARSCCRPGSAP